MENKKDSSAQKAFQSILLLGTGALAGYLSYRFLNKEKEQCFQSSSSKEPTVFNTQKNCRICLKDFDDLRKNTMISCGHTFHLDCFKKLIQTSSICPICRKKFTS